jgi:glycosyltransferase involved in cell wall biosynthesis
MPRPRRTERDKIGAIAVIGNSLPRRCGIATFSTDLIEALAAEAPHVACSLVAMTDTPEGYCYPPRVCFEIAQNRLEDYGQAAEYLNINHIDAACLQHEYGIFGGNSGSHVLKLIDDLRMPVVTTLHTVLKDPSPVEKDILCEIAKASDRVIVMSRRAEEFLTEIYGVPREKIVFIHHGIPDMPFVDPNYHKDLFGVEGRKVLLTFGLLSPGKGIEYMIHALPAVVREHPDVTYIVLGATHPHIKRQWGEAYRLSLQQLARKLGVDERVIFHNRFVDLGELCKFIGCADVYVTPYLNEAQITSGTLAYAMGAGKATVSTPYWYACEMLAENRGRLVPFRDPDALAKQVVSLLSDDVGRHAMRKRAYTFCRDAVWREVAKRYLEVFEEVREARVHEPILPVHPRTARVEAIELTDLPEVKLDHMLRLSDSTGILQHAQYTVPHRSHGYCTDDNARALIVSALAGSLHHDDRFFLDLCARYLAFLRHAFDEETARFRNFMNYERQWIDEVDSEDGHGRSMWALGVAVGYLHDLGLISLSSELFHRGLPATEGFRSPRAIAFALLGIHAYLRRYSGDRDARGTREVLAGRLFSQLKANASNDWFWPENILSYANASLPHALILSGQWMQQGDMVQMGLKALDWLLKGDFAEGHFAPVGNAGWHPRGQERARFDQQPVEAQVTIDACLEAFNVTGDDVWTQRALDCFGWFLGHNDFHAPLYNDLNGGCCDGLMPDGVNENQGAESTLSWLLSLLNLKHFQAHHVLASRRLAADDHGRLVPT